MNDWMRGWGAAIRDLLQDISSDMSPQSFSRSQLQAWGMQRPFMQGNWSTWQCWARGRWKGWERLRGHQTQEQLSFFSSWLTFTLIDPPQILEQPRSIWEFAIPVFVTCLCQLLRLTWPVFVGKMNNVLFSISVFVKDGQPRLSPVWGKSMTWRTDCDWLTPLQKMGNNEVRGCRLNGQRGAGERSLTFLLQRSVPNWATLTFIFPSESLIKHWLHAKSFLQSDERMWTGDQRESASYLSRCCWPRPRCWHSRLFHHKAIF